MLFERLIAFLVVLAVLFWVAHASDGFPWSVPEGSLEAREPEPAPEADEEDEEHEDDDEEPREEGRKKKTRGRR